MDGFKTLPKMQHFKTGGHAKAKEMCWGGKMKTGGEVEHEDAKEDKKMIKKAFGMHDKQQHEEKTDLSGLKKGGRSKKEKGTVRKYKDGGSVAYEAKKTSGDLDKIQKVKETKSKKADAPSKATEKPALRGSDVEKEKSKPAGDTKAKKVSEDAKEAKAPSGAKGGPNKYKTGGKIKKMADGSLTAPVTAADAVMQQAAAERKKRMQKALGTLSPDMQQQAIGQMPPSQQQAAGMAAPTPAPQQPTPDTTNPAMGQMPTGQKRGGRAGKKSCR